MKTQALQTVVAMFLLPTSFAAADGQQLQAGFGVGLGLSGFAIDVDGSMTRVSVFLRGQASARAKAGWVGARAYFYGQRAAGFYVAPFAGKTYCGVYQRRSYGLGVNCDEQWHSVWGVLGGLELGGSESNWSLWVEGGPIHRPRDVPLIRPWTAGLGVRARGPKRRAIRRHGITLIKS